MSLEVYRIIHVAGLCLLFFGLGGVLMANAASSSVKTKIRMLGAITHGLGLVTIIVSGFGMTARLGMSSGFPTWVYLKIGVWLYFGAAMMIAKRKKDFAFLVTTALIAAGVFAAYLGIMKPF